jgi:Family of unknown function (DUF5758)
MSERKQRRVIGWKKLQDRLIAKLEIPKGVRWIRTNSKDNKCRAAAVKVLDVEISCPSARKYNIEHGHDNKVKGGVSWFSRTPMQYDVGCLVVADAFDANPNLECAHGIHFFLTREQAEAYGP